MEQNDYCIVITTYDDATVGERIITALIEQKLAACVQTYPIHSYYTWEGKLTSADETIVLVKTKSALYADVEICIKENHSYEIPEIIRLPIAGGSVEYLKWMDMECK